ncbi:hypothetical protein [Streptomyces sp. NRRL F-4474]|uniref:hypothetical protein n=1 Tax=Streptomyces sp. NRRL F-4474 TaxID=1463851 RepID=UPI000A490E1B|nr:hypothetical protein [Streptomyces sp. NRRL F-4474]
MDDMSAARPSAFAAAVAFAFSDWPLCIDTGEEDGERRPTPEAFSERTGIEVIVGL